MGDLDRESVRSDRQLIGDLRLEWGKGAGGSPLVQMLCATLKDFVGKMGEDVTLEQAYALLENIKKECELALQNFDDVVSTACSTPDLRVLDLPLEKAVVYATLRRLSNVYGRQFNHDAGRDALGRLAEFAQCMRLDLGSKRQDTLGPIDPLAFKHHLIEKLSLPLDATVDDIRRAVTEKANFWADLDRKVKRM